MYRIPEGFSSNIELDHYDGGEHVGGVVTITHLASGTTEVARFGDTPIVTRKVAEKLAVQALKRRVG